MSDRPLAVSLIGHRASHRAHPLRTVNALTAIPVGLRVSLYLPCCLKVWALHALIVMPCLMEVNPSESTVRHRVAQLFYLSLNGLVGGLNLVVLLRIH